MITDQQSITITGLGNGVNTEFTIGFPFKQNSEIQVYKQTVNLSDPDEPSTRELMDYGTDLDEYVIGTGDPNSGGDDDPGVSVILGQPLATNERLFIQRVTPRVQDLNYQGTNAFPSIPHERKMDQILQILLELEKFTVKGPGPVQIDIETLTVGDMLIYKDPFGWVIQQYTLENLRDIDFGRPLENDDFLTYNLEENKWRAIRRSELPQGGSGGSGDEILVGTPSDGQFGVTASAAGITPADTIADAIDKLDSLFDLLAPTPPPDLSDITLTVPGLYTALEESTGTVRTDCTSDTTPTATASNFGDGKTGTLSAEIDSSPEGSIPLTAGDDSGTSGALTIVSDVDPYAGVSGSEGFYQQLVATITPTAPLSFAAHTFRMLHTVSGNTPLRTVTVDDPGVVTVSNEVVGTTGASSYVSGVPGLALGEDVDYSFDLDNAVRTHYNATQVGRATSPQTNTDNLNPGSPPVNGATVPFSGALQVAAAAYTEGLTVTLSGFNSQGTQYTSPQSTNIRIDTVSDESVRRKSGQGQFPTQGSGASQFGDAFDSTEDLNTSGNEELQMLNGRFQYPGGDYTGNTPVGPDYTAVPNGSYANYRWVTIPLDNIVTAVNTTIDFAGALNFGSNNIIPGMLIYVRVIGATPTAGWVDANAAYPGVGNPTNNGDAAMVFGSSTPTSRVVTFGSAPKTGQVWVRIGLPTGSNKSFTGVS